MLRAQEGVNAGGSGGGELGGPYPVGAGGWWPPPSHSTNVRVGIRRFIESAGAV